MDIYCPVCHSGVEIKKVDPPHGDPFYVIMCDGVSKHMWDSDGVRIFNREKEAIVLKWSETVE